MPRSDEYAPWFDAKHPMNEAPPRRVSIDELEKLLNSDEDIALQIMPNGEIRRVDGQDIGGKKPLTLRENLGGEYGVAP